MKKHAAATIKGLLKYGIGFGLLAYVINRYWERQPRDRCAGVEDSP